MWGVIANALAALVPVLVDLWGPPSAEERAALLAACAPLPSPGPADVELEADARDRGAATTVKVTITPPKGAAL